MKKKIISVIAPCYNEEENIEHLYKRVSAVFKKLPSYNFEIVYIDNASTDSSEKILNRLAKKDKRVKVILMSRNWGSPQPSFLAGLTVAKGDAAIPLHGDIQDPPELIPEFVKKWQEGYDVVYGIREKREGYNWIWNLSYRVFYWLLKKMAYITIPLDAGEFSLMDKRVVYELLQLGEYDYYLRCLRAFVGFKQIGISYVRDARVAGKSTESFVSGLWWAKTIILNFSFKPLTWISYFGIIVTLLSFLFIVLNIFWILLRGAQVPGIPTVVVLILFLGGVQLLSLSVIAEYIAKIFLEVKKRPRYIIRKTINVKK